MRDQAVPQPLVPARGRRRLEGSGLLWRQWNFHRELPSWAESTCMQALCPVLLAFTLAGHWCCGCDAQLPSLRAPFSGVHRPEVRVALG